VDEDEDDDDDFEDEQDDDYEDSEDEIEDFEDDSDDFEDDDEDDEDDDEDDFDSKPPRASSGARKSSAVRGPSSAGPSSQQAPIATDQLLSQAIESLQAKSTLTWASLVLQRMQELDSGFNERRAGFDSFDDLLADAERRRRIRTERRSETDSLLITAYRRG
jgi:hypothetical protein